LPQLFIEAVTQSRLNLKTYFMDDPISAQKYKDGYDFQFNAFKHTKV